MARDLSCCTMEWIVDHLGEVYSSGSIAQWLDARNLHLRDARPIELCATDAGRRQVAELVDAMLSGVT